MTDKVWRDRLDPAASRTALAIAQKTGMSDILARVIAGRGVTLEDAAEHFLEPSIRDLMPDPSTLTGLDDGGRSRLVMKRSKKARRWRFSAITTSTGPVRWR